jgi:hypothetical protein
MRNRRRKDLILVICATGALVCAPAVIAAWQHPSPPPVQPRQSPNAPTNQNVPQGLEGQVSPPDTRTPPVDAENERELRLSVQRLYTMVTELKEEIDHTNPRMALNVSVVKRARDIEKLAKQIKDRAGR